MSWSTQVVKGSERKVLRPRLFIYGSAGVGKTSMGAKLPKPIFVDYDKGADYINVDRVPGPKTWADSMALFRGIAADPMSYESLVIDTVDPLEELAIDHVCKTAGKASLAAFDFGAGYDAVRTLWTTFLAELDAVRNAGLYVCLLGHATVRTATDPTLGSYDQFTSQLSKKVWQITQRWCELVGFASFNSALLKEKKDDPRVIVTGERLLYTVRGSGFEAKNRFALPDRMPLSWPVLREAIGRHGQPDDIRARILAMAGAEFGDKARGYLVDAGDDIARLLEIEQALKAKMAEVAASRAAVVPAAVQLGPTTGAPASGAVTPSPAQATAPSAAVFVAVPQTMPPNAFPAASEVPTTGAAVPSAAVPSTSSTSATASPAMPGSAEPPRQSPEMVEFRVKQALRSYPKVLSKAMSLMVMSRSMVEHLQIEEAFGKQAGIETRIREMAKPYPEFAEKAAAFIGGAKGNVDELLKIEEALTERVQSLMAKKDGQSGSLAGVQ